MSAEVVEPPSGAVRFAWFGGILEGSVSDQGALGNLVGEINTLGLAYADLELERGRFSLIFDKQTVPSSRLDPKKSARLVELLNLVVELCSEPAQLESTLHCTEVYEDGVVETLFAIHAGSLDCVSRRRDVKPSDLAKGGALNSGPKNPLPGMSRPLILVVLALFITVSGLMAWRSGLVGQIAAAKAETLTVDCALFHNTLAADLEGSWGTYRVTITRGADYPKAPGDADSLKESANTTAEAAAVQRVINGGTAFVQLLDKNGKVVEAEEISLASLLTDETPIRAKLKGRSDARSIRLALDAGLPRK